MNNIDADKAYQLAKKYYLECGACSQCVVRAVCEVLGIDDEVLTKSAHFLAGGGCSTGQGTCGALAGALLVYSVIDGRSREEMTTGKYKDRLAHGKEFIERFKAEFGGVTCEDFQEQFTGSSFDMWQGEDAPARKKIMKDKCAHLTGTAAKWVIQSKILTNSNQ